MSRGDGDFLEQFCSASNPFLSTRVRNIWEFICDTQDVHRVPFDNLLQEYEEVKKSGQSRGVTIWGSPGVGKSHLLNRFRRAIHEKGLSLLFQVRPLQGEATGWSSHILNGVVSDLYMDTGDGLTHRHSQIVHLLEMLIPNIAEYSSGGSISEHDLANIKRDYREARDSVMGHIDHRIAEDSFKVLVHFLFDQFMITHVHLNPNVERRLKNRILLALKWLKGLQLDTEAKQALGVNQNLGSELIYDPSDAGFFAVLKLLGVVTNGHYPLVLIIDQIETISDLTAEHFARQIHTLLDESNNYLVITCGVRERIADFVDRKVFQEAAFDRLAERKINLEPPPERYYLDIVRDRVHNLAQLRDFSKTPSLKTQHNIFPFTVELLEGMLSQKDVAPTPRQLLTALRDLFESCQRECREAGCIWLENWPDVPPVRTIPESVPPPDQYEVSRYIENEFERQRDVISNDTKVRDLAASDQEIKGILQEVIDLATDGMMANGLSRVRASQEVPGCRSKAVDIALELSDNQREKLNTSSAGLVFDSRGDGRAVFHTFNRLKDHFSGPTPDPGHVFFIRDGRSPFSDSWMKTCEIRGELERRALLTYIELSEPAVIDLLALGAVLQAVKGRDLVIEQGILSSYTVSKSDFGIFLNDTQTIVEHQLLNSLLEPLPSSQKFESGELEATVLLVMKREKLLNLEQLLEICSVKSSLRGNRESLSKELEIILADLSQRGKLIVGDRIARYPMG